MFLHELSDAKDLFLASGLEYQIAPEIIEKDYWLTHCLWGLKAQEFIFDLKGGTSLSKGYGLIHRFSEDVDIKIYPDKNTAIKIGKNHTKSAHIESRKRFFDALAEKIKIPGIIKVERDYEFDDPLVRNAGIRLIYPSHFKQVVGMKLGILLEVGFDTTTPNQQKLISSWAYEKAIASRVVITDNRAEAVNCYLPGFTLVEKLQTISTKYRQFKKDGRLPANFVRHYYDVYCLLQSQEVLDFVGTEDYLNHKNIRFRPEDEKCLTKNEAFLLSDPIERQLFEEQYQKTKALYFKGQPAFQKMLSLIGEMLHKL